MASMLHCNEVARGGVSRNTHQARGTGIPACGLQASIHRGYHTL